MGRAIRMCAGAVIGAFLGYVFALHTPGLSVLIGLAGGGAVGYLAANFILWPRAVSTRSGGVTAESRFNYFGGFVLLGAYLSLGTPARPGDWDIVVVRVLGGGLVAYLIGRYFIWIPPLPPDEKMGLRGASFRSGWTMNRKERLIATSLIGFVAGCVSAFSPTPWKPGWGLHESSWLAAIVRIVLYTGGAYLYARLVWRKGWPDYDRKDSGQTADG